MSTTIPVSVDVPQGYSISKLTRQLADYAKMLVKSQSVEKSHKQYKHEALSGIFNDNATEEELIEDYLIDKYKHSLPYYI